MKKSIIALMVLAGVAAAATPTVYDNVLFADNKGTTLTGQRSHIIFGDTTDETPLTLDSWMIEFDVTKFADTGTLLAIAPPKADSGDGFGIRTHGGSKVGIMFADGTNYYGSVDTADSEIFVTASAVTADTPLTLRVAYDATNNMAYLYDVTNGGFISYEIDENLTLSSVAANHNGGDVNNVTQFFCQGNPVGTINYAAVTVVDMSVLAGDSSAFVNYVKTGSVPEPATATLSLLALAGLAARRRRASR